MQALNGFLNCKTPVFLLLITAGMAELVDAYVSEAYAFTGVRVRLPLPAPFFKKRSNFGALFLQRCDPAGVVMIRFQVCDPGVGLW